MSQEPSATWTARRRNVRAVLNQLSPRILSFFDRAITFAGEVETDDSAVPMLGHALREMTRILPRFVDIPVEKKRVEYEPGLDRIAKDWQAVDPVQRTLTARQFEALAGLVTDHVASRGRADARAFALARTSAHGALEEDVTLLEGLAQRWKKLEREFLELTHVGDDGTTAPAAQALGVLERFEELLDHTLADFWDIDARIKETIAGGASAATYARAKGLPKTIQHWRRLYDQLGPEWLPQLVSSGDMERPPRWVTREDRPMAWPVLDYVERVAASNPTGAAQALLRVPSGINTFAQAQVLRIAMRLEPADVRPLAERARAWVKADASNMLLTEQAGRFMARLAAAGLVEESFAVARELLATRWNTPATNGSGRDRQRALEPRIGMYEYGQMLKTHFPAVVMAAPVRAITLLIQELAGALAKVGPQYWRIWLPEITQPRTREGTVETLVVAIYRATLETATTNTAAANDILSDLAAREGAFMRRLEFAVLGQTELGATRLNLLYRERALFDDPEVFHEYLETLVKRWADLENATREGIRQWIRQGPTYTLREDEDRDRLFAHWRRRLLAVLEPVLPTDWRDEFAEVLKLPAPEHPTHLSWTTMWSGPNSPLTAQQIQDMTNDELIAFLQSWTAPAENGREPSLEGLARVLATVVGASPARFVAELESFRALRQSEYVNAIGDGLVQAVRAGTAVDWIPVVEHLEAELERAKRSDDLRERDGIVWSAVRLLEEAMGSGRATYPPELRERTFALIDTLASHGTRGPSATEASLQHGINTIRGAALETAIRYGLWVAAVAQPDATTRRLTENLRELGDLLALRLGAGGEEDYSVRALAGAFLPQLVYLDREWVAAHLDELLPMPIGGGATEAPWTAFLEFGAPFFGEIYALLRSRYGAALDAFAVDQSRDTDQVFRVGLHALIAHNQNWDPDPTLLNRFFEIASPEVRGRLVQQIGNDLADRDAQFLTDMITRLEALWRERLARSRDPEELREFGLWFASGRFDAVASLDLLRATLDATHGRIDSEDDVTVRLRELAAEHPAAAIELFDQVLANLEHPWTAARLEADGLALVRLGRAQSDAEVTRYAERIRDRFGRLGYSSFEHLDDAQRKA